MRRERKGILLALALIGAQVGSVASMIGAASLVDREFDAEPDPAPAREVVDRQDDACRSGDPLRLILF